MAFCTAGSMVSRSRDSARSSRSPKRVSEAPRPRSISSMLRPSMSSQLRITPQAWRYDSPISCAARCSDPVSRTAFSSWNTLPLARGLSSAAMTGNRSNLNVI